MSKHSSNNTASFITSTILAFLLSIFLTVIGYLFGTYFGLFNKTLIMDSINKTSYYSSIIDYTSNQTEALLIPMGLDSSVLNNVFTLEDTYSEGKAVISASLNGEAYTPDISATSTRLTNNINNYITDNHIELSQEQQNNIGLFVTQVTDSYSKNLSIPYFKYYINLRNTCSMLIYIGIPVLIILSALCIFLLIKAQRWIHRSFRYIAYSFLAAFLMTTIPAAYIIISNYLTKFNISPMYFYNFLVNYVTHSLFTYIYIGVIFLIIALLIIVIINRKRNALLSR